MEGGWPLSGLAKGNLVLGSMGKDAKGSTAGLKLVSISLHLNWIWVYEIAKVNG